jgi:hypothetical protein
MEGKTSSDRPPAVDDPQCRYHLRREGRRRSSGSHESSSLGALFRASRLAFQEEEPEKVRMLQLLEWAILFSTTLANPSTSAVEQPAARKALLI